jgi:hypothetical protein
VWSVGRPESSMSCHVFLRGCDCSTMTPAIALETWPASMAMERSSSLGEVLPLKMWSCGETSTDFQTSYTAKSITPM